MSQLFNIQMLHTLRIIRFLASFSFLHLSWVQIASLQCFVKLLQSGAIHHMQWINYIAQRLAHLPASNTVFSF